VPFASGPRLRTLFPMRPRCYMGSITSIPACLEPQAKPALSVGRQPAAAIQYPSTYPPCHLLHDLVICGHVYVQPRNLAGPDRGTHGSQCLVAAHCRAGLDARRHLPTLMRPCR
jgi:hypothetical protein